MIVVLNIISNKRINLKVFSSEKLKFEVDSAKNVLMSPPCSYLNNNGEKRKLIHFIYRND